MANIKLKIDNKEVEVAEGTTILRAALDNNIEVPYFCYHSKLSIAGNCRMCLVQVKGMNKPTISCREVARPGMEVDTRSEEVKKMQKGVLEFILLNHPLDCPICDQAGECPLQDQYFKFSKFPSRLEDEKIHKPKAKFLGPQVTLDDERCIVCTRCVRFCDEIAGTHELCVTERGGHSELTTYPGKPMTNPYSGCTVDICPVGALTATDFRFKKRVWFLKTAKSICTGCATGCNTKLDWDDGQVYRYRPRENEAVNQCWMCDEGRLTYKFINENRALDPLIKNNGSFETVGWPEAVHKIFDTGVGDGTVLGVLSAQASCEENFALYHFLKNVFSKVTFAATKKEVANPSKDDFLIDADKNPNSAFLKLLGIHGSVATKGLCFVLDNLTEEQKRTLVASKPRLVVWITSNVGEKNDWADLILPKPTFAEQEGTFINRHRRIQHFWKAFEPKGHAKSVWTLLGDLAKELNKEWNFSSAESVFAELSQTIPSLNGLSYQKIGDQGWSISSPR